MIVITTPTGHIGRQVASLLLGGPDPIRVIVRDASRLDSAVREHAAVVEGSHDDPAVLDRALIDAGALFWLVPPNTRAPSAEQHYLAFARAGAKAIRRHGVGHVVAVSSAGHDCPEPAGLLSAAFAMDTELQRSGAAYRALSMPFYMENLLGQLDTIRQQHAFYLTYPADRPLPCIATRDIAQTAAGLLTDQSWTGQEDLPVFGPDRLTPDQMAGVLTCVLGQPIAYHQISLADFSSQMAQQGADEQAIRDLTEMLAAQQNGIYDADWAAATPTSTSFRTWCEQVLAPATS